jgi:hypothetical protein
MAQAPDGAPAGAAVAGLTIPAFGLALEPHEQRSVTEHIAATRVS